MADNLNISNLTLFAGTSWSWVENIPEYPAPDYTLALLLKLGSNAIVRIDSIAEGAEHKFTFAASDSIKLPGGDYHYQMLAISAENTALIDSGIKTILPLLTAENLDPRGYYEKLLEKLRAAYLLAAERGWAEIEVNGRTIRYTRETLTKELENAEYQARIEKRKAQGKKTGKILTRFI